MPVPKSEALSLCPWSRWSRAILGSSMIPMKPAAALILSLVFAVTASAQQWRTGGPSGGPVNAIVQAESDPRTWYVAARDGMYRSSDGGIRWTRIADPGDVAFLLVDPHEATWLYALRSREAGASFPFLYRSVDGGAHWSPLTDVLQARPGEPSAYPTGIAFHPANPEILYVASACHNGWCNTAASGMFRSDDRGMSWTRVPGIAWPSQFSIDPLPPYTIHVWDFLKGYVRSDDGGMTWETRPFLPTSVVVPDPFLHGRRYGVGAVPYIMLSDDGGESWDGGKVQLVGGATIPGWQYGNLEVDRQTRRLFLGTSTTGHNGGLFRSGDGGATWLPIEGAGREPNRQLAFDPADASLTVGTPTGVYRSSGFPWSEWSELAIGHSTREVLGLAVDPRNAGRLYAVAFNRLFVSADSGRSWNDLAGPMPLFDGESPAASRVAVDSIGNVYVTVFVGEYRVVKLPAGSTIWQVLDTPRLQRPPLVVAPAVEEGLEEALYIRVLQGLARSDDGGMSWNPVALAPPHALPLDPARVAIISFGFSYYVDQSFASPDGGVTWMRIGPDAPLLSNLVISRSDPLTLTVIGRQDSERVLFRSRDGGSTWESIRPVMTGGATFGVLSGDTLLVDPRRVGVLYLRTLTGVYRSLDEGASWTSLGRPPRSPWTLVIDRDGHALHVGTAGAGVWSLPLGVPRYRPVGRR
jgi:photosystem II stability/assembly factor-like uncharacterized protein